MKVRYILVLLLASACGDNGNDDNSSETESDGDGDETQVEETQGEGSTDDSGGHITDECSTADNCLSCVGWYNNCTTGLNLPACIAANVCCGSDTTNRKALQACACDKCGDLCPLVCAADGSSGKASIACNECLSSMWKCGSERQACGV